MLLERVAEPAGRPREGALERRIGEWLDLPAVVADQVMVVVVCVGVGGLEPRDAVAEIDPLHEIELDEGVERAVDARDADLATAADDPVVDLLRLAAARVLRELVDDRASSPAAAQAGVAELGERSLGPGRHLS